MNFDQHVGYIREKVDARLAERQAAADAAVAQAAQQAPVDPAEAARQAQVRDEAYKRARETVLKRPAAPLPPNQQRDRADQVRAFVQSENARLREGSTTTAAPAAPSTPVGKTVQEPLTPAAFPTAPNAGMAMRLPGPETEDEERKRLTHPDAVRRGEYAQHRAQLLSRHGAPQLASGTVYVGLEPAPASQQQAQPQPQGSGVPPSVLAGKLQKRRLRKRLGK